ncbi:MAG TPA: hypothetical protein ENH55_16710 [Aurantimonas coralicida]|uniref:Uncharacterized protein n=1 Tax=marine sediment metagenome TaxID=412755 RepID=A0A0F9TD33_9ZZZZ|nr:hypothetical protein [Aurantimonas coralicida]
MTLYFAWVDASETTFGVEHEVEDEQVFRLTIRHEEGEFAKAEVEIANPRVGLLGAGRKRWAWISFDTAATPGVVPLFFGRLLGLPQRLAGETVTLEFLARPADFDARKDAAAAALKVAPFWDPVWIEPERRDDPDAVLEARAARWHIDRTTHAVTASDVNAGEDGTLDFGAPGDATVFYSSLEAAPLQPPARRIRVEAEVLWDQAGAGSVDLRQSLIAAFVAAGTSAGHVITSYTGEGLEGDWPDPGARIGAGWRVGASKVLRGEGVWINQIFQPVTMGRSLVKFPLWTFAPTFTVEFEAERSRSERVVFELEADTQEMLTDVGDAEVLALDLSSFEIAEAIDDQGSAGFTTPIGDVRRNSYFVTDRGKQSLEHLIARARAELLERARAVEIGFETTWAEALDLSCRLSARVVDARLPGGEATGKVVSYVLGIEGDSGQFSAEVTIACTVGQGTSVSAAAGSPDYVEDGYVEDGYQTRSGAIVLAVAGEVGYTDYDDQGPPNDGAADDGVDLLRMTPARSILSLQVFDGQDAQEAVLDQGFTSLAVAIEALNEAFTEVDLSLVPLDGGPFAHTIDVTVTGLAVPKTIDLEAT